MKRARLRNNAFHRIGNRYAPYFDHDHFMGRSAFDEVGSEKNMNLANKVLEVPLDGYERDEITISELDGKLYIVAKKKDAYNYADDYLRHELHLEEYEKVFDLEPNVVVDSIIAILQDGILRIRLPMAIRDQDQPHYKSISVK